MCRVEVFRGIIMVEQSDCGELDVERCWKLLKTWSVEMNLPWPSEATNLQEATTLTNIIPLTIIEDFG